jgi:hypothetical protein
MKPWDDEYRVEISVRVVPRDTARKVGTAHADGEFKYGESDAARLIEMLAKAFDTAFRMTEKGKET